MMAGVVVVELQPFPHRPPSDMAFMIAAVSSVAPSLRYVSVRELS